MQPCHLVAEASSAIKILFNYKFQAQIALSYICFILDYSKVSQPAQRLKGFDQTFLSISLGLK